MANGISITVVGNLTADPELRHTQGGVSVASFTVASTPRVFDRQANEWKDGDTTFLRVSCWRHLAEHVAASLKKGMRVVVTGELQQREFTDKEGNARTTFEVQADEVSVSLQYGTAVFQKSARGGANASGAGAVAQAGQGGQVSVQAQPQPAPQVAQPAPAVAAPAPAQQVAAAQAVPGDIF